MHPIGHSVSLFLVQVDIFSIKAVSLGKLKKVLISHDGTGPGKIWLHHKKFALHFY